MLRSEVVARVTIGVLAMLVCSTAFAEDAVEEPMAAIQSRGIVLKVGKRHHLVIVPPAKYAPGEYVPPGSTLYHSLVYFGDEKTLYRQTPSDWTDALPEKVALVDIRSLAVATLARDHNRYTLTCTEGQTKRTFELTVGERATLKRAAVVEEKNHFNIVLFARQPRTTTYVVVDTPARAEWKEFRVFIGKRGAMKQLAVTEIASDTDGLVLVTPKGTLEIKQGRRTADPPAATYGSATKFVDLTILDIATNQPLIARGLGIYPAAVTGYPCDEL